MKNMICCLTLLFLYNTASAFKVTADEGTNSEQIVKEEVVPFAPTISTERKGSWFGGAPPLNKRASKIDTYYRIKAAKKSNHFSVTLRFEGAIHEDAKVTFRPIDGAKFKQKEQRNKWRLKPNIASQVSFIVVVPSNISYLTLDTWQNGKGASRAFILEKPIRHKKHRH